MNSRKVNWFFLTTILLHVFIVVLLVVFRFMYNLGIVANFALSSGIIVVPALIFLFFSKESISSAIGLKKIKWSTAGMIVLFTYLTMPLATFINSFSMLFVDNAMAEISDEIMEVPFLPIFFFMAIVGPIGEEFVFRGIVYRGYRKSGTILQAMILSAVLFALGHMNFNQAAYALVIGVILVMLVEATGSIWASIIYHVIFNGHTVCMMYLAEHFFPEEWMEAQESALTGAEYRESLIYSMAGSAILAAFTLAIAVCVLIWIAKNERRIERFKMIWSTRHEKTERVVTFPLILAIGICFAYMLADAILTKMIS